MSGEADETLLLHRHGRAAVVTLNRPTVINAVNTTIRVGLPKLLAELDADAGVAAIILSGAGPRGFCVGADINEAREALAPAGERRRLTDFDWIESVARCRKPTIAALHGFCLGGGLELALACDLRLAAENTQLGLPETALGLIPGGGGTQRLPRLIGLGPALHLLLTGERIDAAEAHRLGLVSRLLPSPEACRSEAIRLAELIATRPPTAIAYVKEAAYAALESDLARGLALERSLFALLTASADRREAAAAFRDKRPPNFTGE
jgi:enoyl-CoA hydratase/carnithine racemase